MHTTTRTRRGSALIMVVGLLSIIAMIGTAFYLTSHMENEQSAVIASRVPIGPIAEGVLSQVLLKLSDDLHIDPVDTTIEVGPYTDLSDPNVDLVKTWLEFVDAPGMTTDPHLACTTPLPEAFPTWRHLTDLVGNGMSVEYVSTSADELSDTDGYDPLPTQADPTAKREKDAVRLRTGWTDSTGLEYFYAVRVTDLSGLLCLNTASGPDTTDTTLKTSQPALVDLRKFFVSKNVQGVFDNLNDWRFGTLTDDKKKLKHLHEILGTHVLRPLDPFAENPELTPVRQCFPYTPGEEVCLRYLGGGTGTNATDISQNGRVWAAMGSRLGTHQYPTARRLLTTMNSQRPVMRFQEKRSLTHTPDFYYRYCLTNKVLKGDQPAERERLYYVLEHFLKETSPATSEIERRKAATHFVANLWARYGQHEKYDNATEHSEDPNYPWVFACPHNDPGDPSSNYTAYGMIRRPVITEAYAVYSPDTADPATGVPANDWYWGCAIEIWNHDKYPIDLRTYRVRLGDGTWKSLANVKLKANERYVIYDVGSGENAPRKTADAIFADWDQVPNKEQIAGFDFGDSGKTVLLAEECLKDSRTEWIAADQMADLSYSTATSTDPADPNAPALNIRVWKRDDHPDRQRFNVADAVIDDSPDTETNAHTLGRPNTLSSAEHDKLDDFVQFPVAIDDRSNGFRSIGDLFPVYWAGPSRAGAPTDPDPEILPFSMNIRTGPMQLASNGSTIYAGRLNLVPPEIPNPTTPGRGQGRGGLYPDLPVACLLGEFITMTPLDDRVTPQRTYGFININTAPAEVLAHLPFPETIKLASGSEVQISAATAAEYIYEYRELRGRYHDDHNVPGDGRASAVVKNARALPGTSNVCAEKCFLTPGEVAIPLGHYAAFALGWPARADDPNTADMLNTAHPTADSLLKDPDFIQVRDQLYASIANMITTQSNTYAVTISVDVGTPANPKVANSKVVIQYSQKYLAIIDRSNCDKASDRPTVVLFCRTE